MIPLLISINIAQDFNNYVNEYIENHKIKTNHVFHIIPEKSELSISQIRSLQQELAYSTISDKLFVIEKFDTASTEAQNASLKMLEEHSNHYHFILRADNIEAVLPTIRSRCRLIKFKNNLSAKNQEKKDLMELFESVIMAKDLSFFSSSILENYLKADPLVVFDYLILFLRNLILSDNRSTGCKILKKAFNLRQLYQSNNIQAKLAIDNLLISLHNSYKLKI